LRVSRYPVERNFIPPRHEQPTPAYDVRAHLGPLLAAGQQNEAGRANGHSVGLQVNGPGGGQWRLRLDGDRVTAADWGLPAAGTSGFYLSAATFRSLVGSEVSVGESINTGRLFIEGAGQPMNKLFDVLKQIVSTGNGNHRATHTVN